MAIYLSALLLHQTATAANKTSRRRVYAYYSFDARAVFI
jgi:hypothetical protein